MKKNDWKCLIDALLLASVSSIAVIGLLLAFVIPSGKSPDASKYFLGLHRHEWGDIHLYLSLFMLVLLVLHLWLNWAWISHSAQNLFGRHWKNALRLLFFSWIPIVLIAWAIMV